MQYIFQYRVQLPDTNEIDTQFLFDHSSIDEQKQTLDRLNKQYIDIIPIEVRNEDVEYIKKFFDIWTELIFDTKNLQFYPPEEQLQKLRVKQIDILNNYTYSLLTPTDWVVTKIQETEIFYGKDSEEFQSMHNKYEPIILERLKIREFNKIIENYLNTTNSWLFMVYLYTNLDTLFKLPDANTLNMVIQNIQLQISQM